MEERELWVLANCLLSGLIFGVLFDIFRIVRRSFDEKGRMINFFDGLFWMVYTVLFIRRIFIINGGDLRWFVFAGVILGVLLYFSLLSRIFMPIGTFLMKLIKKCIKFAVAVLMFPVKLCLKVTHRILITAIVPLGLIKKKLTGLKLFFRHRMHMKHFCAKKI